MPKIVLIVDDEPLFRAAVRDALVDASTGIRVLEASGASEAIAMLEQNEVAAILADVHMPDGDGFHLLAAIKNGALNVPVVMVSAHGDASARRRIRASGALTYLDKPVDLDEVVHTLLTLCETSPSRVAGLSLAGFLQLLELEKKTVTVWLRNAEDLGRIDLARGVVMDASCKDLQGRAAALQLLRWTNAIIDLQPAPNVVASQSALGSLTELMLEAARLDDEASSNEIQDLDLGFETLERSEIFGSAAPVGSPGTPAHIEATLAKVMQIDGTLAAALVDHETGDVLGAVAPADFNIRKAAAGNRDVVQSKIRVMKDLGLEEPIEDILITVKSQFHLIRLLRSFPHLFLYLSVDRQKGSLALARLRLQAIENELEI